MTAAVTRELRMYIDRHDKNDQQDILTLRLPKNVQQVHISRDIDGVITGNVLSDAAVVVPWPQVG